MESLQRSLEVLNNLNGVDLARMIWEQGPPPVGWGMDVYIRNGEIYFTDYYTVGTIIEYEPDVVVIATRHILDWFWHGEYATLEWLDDCIVDAINEIEARLLEKEEVQEK